MEIPQELLAELVTALLTSVILLAIYGLKLLRDLVRSKMGESEYNQALLKISIAKEKAMTVVRYLAQSPVFKEYSGEKLKELAMLYLSDDLKAIGFSDLQVDWLIEEAVNVLKSLQSKLITGELLKVDSSLGQDQLIDFSRVPKAE